ncbi:MAG: nucleotidyltransferase family protein [Phocaeicola massiliensis]|jgi:D-glycero-alpha-D-manno-heptose 1-phosphate guanylyltransferase|nr:nucleotidyltransferase family protein [Phocaeicola massiliensis]
MEVIILAGGLGTRLRSAIGNEIPKCMAFVAGKPFLWYLLKYLTRYDVNRVVLSVGYLREVIYKWVDEMKKDFSFEFDYAVEEEPLGTGGGIKLALSKCQSNDVVVLNGDTFFDVNLNKFYDMHRLASASVSLALKPMRNLDRYGRVLIDTASHKVKAFCEKQHCAEGLINGGVYFISRSAIDEDWPLKEKFSFETEVLESSVVKGNLYAFDFDGYFIDIGIPSDYKKANEDFKQLF